MTTPAFSALLDAARNAHRDIDALRHFCAFPDDLTETDWQRFDIPAARLMARETCWTPDAASAPLFHAFLAAADDAQWRETYKGTAISDDFMQRFGCYCLIGPGAPWISAKMFGFVVYMPPDLWYPWHEHPAEELYYVLAGGGEFFQDGVAPEVLHAGQASFHASNRPHALRTHDQPLLAYVLWRNNFDTPPILSPGRSLAKPETVNHPS